MQQGFVPKSRKFLEQDAAGILVRVVFERTIFFCSFLQLYNAELVVAITVNSRL